MVSAPTGKYITIHSAAIPDRLRQNKASLTFRAGDDTLSINRGNRLPVFPCDKLCKRCKRDKRDKRDRRVCFLTHFGALTCLYIGGHGKT